MHSALAAEVAPPSLVAALLRPSQTSVHSLSATPATTVSVIEQPEYKNDGLLRFRSRSPSRNDGKVVEGNLWVVDEQLVDAQVRDVH